MKKTFNISIPTDKGFWGRECPSCKKYFKIDAEHEKETLYCPYCGKNQKNDNLDTKQQAKAIDEIAGQIGLKMVEDEMDKIFKNLARTSKSITYKQSPRARVNKITKHLEKEIDTEIGCSNCSTKFQVFGIFGFCPGCGEDNIMIYEANLQIILKEINNSDNPKRNLRHAYKDLVTTFELYSKRVARINKLGDARFQNLLNTKKFFKKYDLDIYKGLIHTEKVIIKRIFEKRHAYEHRAGEINDSYIKNVPEDSKLLGKIAELSIEEFSAGVDIIKKIIGNIRNKYSS